MTATNSWADGAHGEFMSIDANSPLFLKPKQGTAYENIGAYAAEEE